MKSPLPLKLLTLGLALLGGRGFAAPKDAKAKSKVVDLNQVDVEQVEQEKDGDDDWDNASPNQEIDPGRGVKVKDIMEPTSDYTYASFGKPDPFTMMTAEEIAQARGKPVATTDVQTEPDGEGPNGKEISITSALQQYPLDDLRVKGIWQLSSGEMRAVILTPKNEGVIVKVGDPISSGKVLDLKRDSVIVRLYKLRKDGVREYEDSRIHFGLEAMKATKISGTIKLEPGKEAQFPEMEKTGDSSKPDVDVIQKKASKPDAPAAKPAAAAQAPAPAAPAAPKPAAPQPVAQPAAPAQRVQNIPAIPVGGDAAKPVLGWPFNNGPAQPPAPTSTRPGASK